MSTFFKSVVASVFFYTGLVDKRIQEFHKKSSFLILMYHRVIPAGNSFEPGMYVCPETLENHLVYLQKHFKLIPLNHLVLNHDNRDYVQDGKPLCILTFDDGWKDFYDYAFPLLVKYQQPATVFLPTEFIGSNNQFWTDKFAYLLFRQSTQGLDIVIKSDIQSIVHYLNGLRGSFLKKLEMGINFLKNQPLWKIEKVLKSLSIIWNVEVDQKKRDFLNWSEVKEIADSGLVTFGSHTANHQILTTLDEADILKELRESQKKLLTNKFIDNSCSSFCYPNGNYSCGIVDMVRTCGYQLAVTTDNGWNNDGADNFLLKRVAIHQDMTSTTPLFASRIAELI